MLTAFPLEKKLRIYSHQVYRPKMVLRSIETVVNASEIVRNDNVNSKVYLLFLRAPMSTELGKALSRSNKTKNEDFSRLTLVLPFSIEIRIIINSTLKKFTEIDVWLVRDKPFGLYRN